MQLFYRIIGQGEPFVVLHGLYGASDNWVGIARAMSNEYQFILPDLRNHGQSAHSDEFNYEVMCDDLCELLDECKIDKVILMGHSMGGKLAMEFAKRFPAKVSKLIVLDVSPLSYIEYPREGLLNHECILKSMLSIDLLTITNRKQVKKALLTHIGNSDICSFLIKNLTRNEEGALLWRLNLSALMANYMKISEEIVAQNYTCKVPTLFVKSEKSRYINPLDEAVIRNLYFDLEFIELSNARHWLHVEQQEELIAEVHYFLNK